MVEALKEDPIVCWTSVAALARRTDELIVRNTVCAARDGPLLAEKRQASRGTFGFTTSLRTERLTAECSRLSFEGLFNHHYAKPAHMPSPDLWNPRRRPSSTKGIKLFTTSGQKFSNHLSYSYRTSLVLVCHLAPTVLLS